MAACDDYCEDDDPSYDYVVYLGDEGFEGMIDITGMNENAIISKLSGKTFCPSTAIRAQLSHMSLRMTINGQRNIIGRVVNVQLKYDEFRDILEECKEMRTLVKEKGAPFPN